MVLKISKEIVHIIRNALDEDIGIGDVTTFATVPSHSNCMANMVAREPLVVAGLNLTEAVFREVSDKFEMRTYVNDGDHVQHNQPLLRIEGQTQAILTAERVALNFIQRLSGVATMTASYVEAIKGTHARILDTRKTTPGWRRLEKYAVTCGGGHNHRFGLFDMVLIKDNHLAALKGEQPNSIAAAIQRARATYSYLKVEVEADTIEQAVQAAEAGADIIMLDNMSPEQMRHAIKLIDGRAKTEASGGVKLHTVRAIAETGVDYISVGAITHSARSVDIALDFET